MVRILGGLDVGAELTNASHQRIGFDAKLLGGVLRVSDWNEGMLGRIFSVSPWWLGKPASRSNDWVAVYSWNENSITKYERNNSG